MGQSVDETHAEFWMIHIAKYIKKKKLLKDIKEEVRI